MSNKPITVPKEAYQNTEQQCDFVLGQYFRGWGQVEHAMFDMFHKLSGTDITTANIIFSAGIDYRTMRGICDALGKVRLNGPEYRTLVKLLDRVKTVATTRNRLVHGAWFGDVVIDDEDALKAKSVEWMRLYRPTDPEAFERMFGPHKDQKTRATHLYSLKRIVELTEEASKLGKAIRNFLEGVQLLPIRVPQPVF